MMRYVSKAAVKSSKIRTIIQPESAVLLSLDTKRSLVIFSSAISELCPD